MLPPQIGLSGALAPPRPDDPDPWGDKLGILNALISQNRQKDFVNGFISQASPSLEALQESLHRIDKVAGGQFGATGEQFQPVNIEDRLHKAVKGIRHNSTSMTPEESAARWFR